MNKHIKTAVLLTAIALSSSSAFAADGQVKFTGKILDAACTVDGATDGAITVTMGEVSKTSLAAAGDTTDATKFHIKLSACPDALTTASIKFDGTAMGGDDSILALTAGTVDDPSAEQVGIQITDSAGAVVPLYTASTAIPATAGGTADTGTFDLPFTARYISTGAAVKAGVADAAANFTVVYN
ncbi:fimbrial protein [Rahnella inusitata]|uniref:fimbrial protein n=1 Tax=Rahnella inusitata TaxID=58169 RepID=UPI001BC868B4|nr:fimbrial protein [Rahnella inusitata]QUT15774.1 fimbrial protein [Rahnella inusitata]